MQRSSALGAFLILSVSLALTAQTTTTGEMSGYVSDSSGAAAPGIVVTLSQTITGAIRYAVANRIGAFHFSLLAPGNYAISASNSTLASPVQQLAVAVGQAASLDLVVSPRMAAQTIDVSDTQPLLPLTSPDLRTTFSKSELDTLPSRAETSLLLPSWFRESSCQPALDTGASVRTVCPAPLICFP